MTADSETARLLSLSPLDGRYAGKLDDLRPWLSEFGLIRQRVVVELRWFAALADAPAIGEVPALSPAARDRIETTLRDFSPADAAAIRAIEARTNHDVKAVEYWLKERFAPLPELASKSEFLHFACTSEDINNLAYALMLAEARERCLLPEMDRLIGALRRFAGDEAEQPMLSRTHGQPATPTTLGKELANVGQRLLLARRALAAVEIRGKANGAVGNFAAHVVAYPDVDWEAHARAFVESLGLAWNPLTTQIEPHDWMADYAHALQRFDAVLLDFVRDVWSYVSIGYFRQRAVAGEVGSSTMPHKVNPIDFENAEGNLGLANAVLGHLAEKLPVSRWQRDLSDSTALRNFGSALGHALLAIRATLRGLGKLAVDRDRMAADLAANPAVLAEAVQTVMRRYGIPEPYEKLKAATRGHEITLEDLHRLVEGLALPETEKKRLLELTPARYVGLAARQARRFADGR
ncbi:MAG: adenylosuccinate lyase [Myxococcota bacterium]